MRKTSRVVAVVGFLFLWVSSAAIAARVDPKDISTDSGKVQPRTQNKLRNDAPYNWTHMALAGGVIALVGVGLVVLVRRSRPSPHR